jgi:hypothetical protein
MHLSSLQVKTLQRTTELKHYLHTHANISFTKKEGFYSQSDKEKACPK